MGIYCILAAVLSKLNSLGTHEHAKVSEIRLRVFAKVIFFFFWSKLCAFGITFINEANSF